MKSYYRKLFNVIILIFISSVTFPVRAQISNKEFLETIRTTKVYDHYSSFKLSGDKEDMLQNFSINSVLRFKQDKNQIHWEMNGMTSIYEVIGVVDNSENKRTFTCKNKDDDNIELVVYDGTFISTATFHYKTKGVKIRLKVEDEE